MKALSRYVVIELPGTEDDIVAEFRIRSRLQMNPQKRPGSESRSVNRKKCWIHIRIESMLIRNPA
jgi:hypothetical protein